MFKQDIYATYKYQAKNLDNKTLSFQEKATTVLEYDFVKTYDMVDDIQSGTFSNRLISLHKYIMKHFGKRRTKRHRKGNKRRTKRVYKMRGG
jgi:hypothetical protein